jgi:pSer/pThr/pTyr-binding forkhead associated (FHA) protein
VAKPDPQLYDDPVLAAPQAIEDDSQSNAIHSLPASKVEDSTLDRTVVLSPSQEADPQTWHGNDVMGRMLSRVLTLIVAGQRLAALSACCEVESWLAREPDRPDLKATALELRRSLARDLLVTDELELIGSATRIRPIAAHSALIGRPSVSRTVDIAINCRWFSRGERSLFLFSEGENWFVEDLGSANGAFIGDKKLEANEPHLLSSGETLIEIGRSPDDVAPVILRFMQVTPAAVLVAVQPGGAFKDRELTTWPTLQEDLKKRWLVFRQTCFLGADENAVLAQTPEEALAALSFDEGYRIAPLGTRDLRIDDMPFRTAAPLLAGAWIEVGGLRLRSERVPESGTISLPPGSQG